MNKSTLIEKAVAIINKKGTDGVYTFPKKKKTNLNLYYYEELLPHKLLSMYVEDNEVFLDTIVKTKEENYNEKDRLCEFDNEEIEQILSLAR